MNLDAMDADVWFRAPDMARVAYADRLWRPYRDSDWMPLRHEKPIGWYWPGSDAFYEKFLGKFYDEELSP